MIKNMKISVRLIAAFLIAVIISSIAGVVGITLLNKSDASYSDALVQYGFAQGNLGNLGRAYQKQRAVTLYQTTATTPEMYRDFEGQLAEVDASIDEFLEVVGGEQITSEEQANFAKLTAALNAFRTARDSAFTQMEIGTSDVNMALLKTECGTKATEFSNVLDGMIADKSTIGLQVSDELSAQTKTFTFVMIAVMVLGFVVAMVLALFIARSISKPIIEVEEAAKELSKGNLSAKISYVSNDEVGALAESMRISMATFKSYIDDIDHAMGEMAKDNFDVGASQPFVGDFENIEKSISKFITTISQTLGGIKDAADQVSTGSDQVSSSAQALAQGATEQASSVEELSASITDVSNQIKLNAENASKVNEMSIATGEGIQRSNMQMQKLVEAMNDINVKSSEISKIIKTIEDIAFQTNILALNAAVEAARAGAAGKGFAVVADEVRNLATKSSEAAKNTTALIEGSIEAVGVGTRIAGETAKELLVIVEEAKNTTSLVNEVTEATNNQATSIAQINLGVEQISSVVQTNSATSEESAAASEELSGQATVMNQLISKFTLKKMDRGMMQQVNYNAAPTIPTAPVNMPAKAHEHVSEYSRSDYAEQSYNSGFSDKY